MIDRFTIEAWIYPTGTGSGGGGIIVNKEGEYEIARFEDGTIRWAFAMPTAPGWNWVSTGFVAPLNQWTHVAVAYGGGAIKTYANGALVHSFAGGGTLGDVHTENDFRIGGRSRPSSSAQNFQGLIDEVKLFGRALSQTEITSLYLAGGNGACKDRSAPNAEASLSPSPNAAGWNRENVTVSVSAEDDDGGSGVKSVAYSATGAQEIAETIVDGAAATFGVTAEGVTSVTYKATDRAGNTAERTLEVKIDKSAPEVVCGAADGAWHAADVAIACTASDAVSWLANDGDAGFSLTTSVPAGAETDNAATGTREVCDISGNCATAGPVGGNKVDRKAPSITINSPAAGAIYLLNQSAAADYSCADAGSGVNACAGPSADGGAINTSAAGPHIFTVTTRDGVGNEAAPQSVNYVVLYGVRLLYDAAKGHKSGSTVPVRLQLVDASGANVSSASVLPVTFSVRQISAQDVVAAEDAGNANPDGNFRYDPALAGYVFNLKTTGLTRGVYALGFRVGAADGHAYWDAQFSIR